MITTFILYSQGGKDEAPEPTRKVQFVLGYSFRNVIYREMTDYTSNAATNWQGYITHNCNYRWWLLYEFTRWGGANASSLE